MSAAPGARSSPPDHTCHPGSDCPISGGPCPGECIYAEVMNSQRLGVVIFDLGRASLLFVNRFARDLFQGLGQDVSYDGLRELLLPDGGGDHEEASEVPASLRIGTHLLGFTVYRARTFAWVQVRDITHKARLESIAEAVNTMNNIGYVFSAVRHELGNPINSVKAAVSVLRANLETYPTRTVAEYLDRIASEVGRVENLLRSLKSFSLYERPALQPLEVGRFVQDFVGLVRDDARGAGIALEVGAACECWAMCDPRALQQVMLNLYANAADALRGRAEPRLAILLGKGEGLVSLRVVDTGAGMSEQDARNAFKPFFTTKEHGTGLGLVISRKLLAKMGATIALESRAGAGTTVHIALPESLGCPTPT